MLSVIMLEYLFDISAYALPIALLAGWLLDLLLGDPSWLPHPVVYFGKMIAWGEKRLNHGKHRKLKGGILAIGLVLLVFFLTFFILRLLASVNVILYVLLSGIIIFYCLAGTTLIHEVRDVFVALDRSLEEGRQQVARIVGRDTKALSAQEVRTAALETLAENLSDGVIAPLFWLLLLGPAGMLAYKMVNTLDSMLGYRTERYRDFGCLAARQDDAFNYIPARLTALLMILPHAIANHQSTIFHFVRANGRNHASPNSGYPEASLAGILDCRFGGPHEYFGQLFDKPFIGTNPRQLTTDDMKKAVRVNRTAEVLMLLLTATVFVVGSFLV